MAQDWFAANAPQQAAAPKQDWFAANAPAQPQQQPMSLIQRARAYVDRLSTPIDDPDASWASNKLARFGAGVIANTAGVVNHPYEAAKGFVKSITPDDGGAGIAERLLGPAGPMAVHMVEGFVKDPALAAGGLTGGALLGEAAAPVVRAGVAKVAAVPEAVRFTIAGPNLDKPIPGEAVTPRQQYAIAKDQGVQLDAAQATGSPVLNAAKKVTDSSLGGAPKFSANFGKNVNALQIHAENVLDQASPQVMTREEFGNAAKAKLQEDLVTQKDLAGSQFDQLTESVGDNQPSVKGIQQQAKQIVKENAGYYDKHPEMLKGGARTAWQIISNLAKAPEEPKPVMQPFDDGFGPRPTAPAPKPIPKDTWSDLHMLRSDLMDLTRGPEYIGDRPTGWIKQMTGAVDNAMTDASAGLTKTDLANFRAANDIYTRVKDTYDNPQHPLYHVIRQPDGLTIANQLANMKPAIARQFATAAPDLVPQLQRQTMDRVLRPQGNEVPDLQNLPTRFKNLPKEQLSAILSPKQVTDLENLARTSRQVYSTDNPSGTANKMIPNAELMGAGAALTEAGHAFLTGDPVTATLTAGAPAAYYAATRAVGRALTSPAAVDRLVETPAPQPGAPPVSPTVRAALPAAAVAARGQDRWAQLGAAKLEDHIGRMGRSAEISAEDVDALSRTPKGKQLLIQASDLEPGSAAMRNLVKQIKALQQ